METVNQAVSDARYMVLPIRQIRDLLFSLNTAADGDVAIRKYPLHDNYRPIQYQILALLNVLLPLSFYLQTLPLKTPLLYGYELIVLSVIYKRNCLLMNSIYGDDCIIYSLRFPLVSSLVLVVYSAEIGNNHRYRQCDHQHSAKRTNSTHDFTRYGRWYHIAVSVKNEIFIQYTDYVENFRLP